MNVGQCARSLANDNETIRVWMKTQVLKGVPIAIMRGYKGGRCNPRRGHGRQPDGGYIAVAVGDSRPISLEYAEHLHMRSRSSQRVRQLGAYSI